MRLLPEPHDIRIRDTANRVLDMAACQSNVAEVTIIHLPKRFDRRTAVQIVYERLCPNPEPAEKSARIEGHCRLGTS
jgi:hypothetical protein